MIRFVLQPGKMVGFNNMVSRWAISFTVNNTRKTNLICDRANEDHCGSCGNGLLTNNPYVNYHITNNKLTDYVFTEDEMYYFPFTI